MNTLVLVTVVMVPHGYTHARTDRTHLLFHIHGNSTELLKTEKGSKWKIQGISQKSRAPASSARMT